MGFDTTWFGSEPYINITRHSLDSTSAFVQKSARKMLSVTRQFEEGPLWLYEVKR